MTSYGLNLLSEKKALVVVPTYNERENAPALCRGLLDLNLKFDILFVDDNSPDGTGRVIDELCAKHPNVKVLHRPGKQGIGSAHLAGIDWAYDHGYDILITMDCDFTHPPEYVLRSLNELEPDGAVVVGSRYILPNSLPGWAANRRFLTRTGHIVTQLLLGIPYDATGALRLYRLDKIPRQVFHLTHSKGYSFFFESLFVLYKNGCKIQEFPIELPARTYGDSKMSWAEVFRSVKLLCSTFFISRFSPEKYQHGEPVPMSLINPNLVDKQGWDYYWQEKKPAGGLLYDAVASFYRKFIIQRSLKHFISENFAVGAKVLHAGCGSGQVDLAVKDLIDIKAMDISVNALHFYKKTNGNTADICHGSIFDIPLPESSVDGVYNLGVLEHFTDAEIQLILAEFGRVLKPGARAVIFWPPEHGISVLFFKALRWFYAVFLRNPDKKFHPDEITRLTSRAHAEEIVRRAGLSFIDYYFGPRDMFTYSVVIAQKPVEGAMKQPVGGPDSFGKQEFEKRLVGAR